MTPSTSPTTSDPVLLRTGGAEVVVHPVGASMQAYRVGGVDLLDGFGALDAGAGFTEVARTGYRGATLVPWPNRVREGRWTYDGAPQQLDLTEQGRDTALHGLAATVPWAVRTRFDDAVALTRSVGPAPGYPCALQVEVAYGLRASGLDVTTSVVNVGDRPAPFGAGAHPYLSLGEERVDDLEVRVEAGTWLAADDAGIATVEQPVDGTPYDLRRPTVLGDRALDDCLGGLDRDADGLAWVHLRGTRNGRRLSMWLGPEYRWVMLFTGDGLPLTERRRRSLAVEPMTCPPDALRSGRDLVTLSPQERVVLRWGLRVEGPTA